MIVLPRQLTVKKSFIIAILSIIKTPQEQMSVVTQCVKVKEGYLVLLIPQDHAVVAQTVSHQRVHLRVRVHLQHQHLLQLKNVNVQVTIQIYQGVTQTWDTVILKKIALWKHQIMDV